MTKQDAGKEQSETEEKMPWHQFLVEIPPGRRALVSSFVMVPSVQRPASKVFEPVIQLYCNHKDCNGFRFFECKSEDIYLSNDAWKNAFVTYTCKNCETVSKTYALLVRRESSSSLDGEAIKIGEWPPFGPYTPPRVISLIGPDRELFLKGRRAENQGLGIGAFAYYRRVIDNQWKRLINNIIKVAKKVSAPEATIKQLEAAEKETQFSRAVDDIKDAIPQVLLINGHNPLTLLYSALSDGIHVKNDEKCLELATSIRIVLTELADKLGQAMKDHAELNDAITRLLKSKESKSPENS